MSFNDRKKGFEDKFAHDQELMFKIEARASKLFGLWAAEKLGLAGADAATYAAECVAANLDEPGLDDLKRKAQADFAARDIKDVSDHLLDTMLDKYLEQAQEQVLNDRKG